MKKIKSLFILLAAVFLATCSSRTKIGSVIFNASGDWFVESIAGMTSAAKEYNADIDVENCWYDFDSEAAIIKEFLDRKVDAVVISPLNPAEASVSMVTEQGIPVITWNTVLSMPVTSKVTVDSFMLGKQTGDALVKYIEENELEVQNAFFITDSLYSVGIERCDGFKESIKPLVLDGRIRVLGEEDAELSQQIRTLVARILEQEPSLSLIWCWNQTSLSETLHYLEEAGRNDIYVCGTDMSTYIAKKMLEPDSRIIAVTDQNPYRMGYKAVETAVKAARGEPFPEASEIELETYVVNQPEKIRKYIEEHVIFMND